MEEITVISSILCDNRENNYLCSEPFHMYGIVCYGNITTLLYFQKLRFLCKTSY